MPSSYTRTYVDHSDERSAASLWIRQVTAANFDDTATLLAALGTAMDNMVSGMPVKTATQSNSLALPNTAADTPPGAQRELKWVVSFIDESNGKKARIEVPTADVTLSELGSDKLSILAGPGLAFKTAFEAIARSVDGNTVEVTGIRLVGRNL